MSEEGVKLLFDKCSHVITASSSDCVAPSSRRMGQTPLYASNSMHEEVTSRLVSHFLDRIRYLSLVNESPMTVVRYCCKT